jgi:phenylpropionate dioxygenase-like ring-hydroxylating dioxygenase large terminal subunit
MVMVRSDLERLVQWDRGLVSPEIYFDERIYRVEIERVFGLSWLPVAHEDMVRRPGDFVTNYMGEVPVVVIRGGDGVVRVFINRCRHRGNQVCLFDRGNTRNFTCSYHGWTYSLEGRLVGVPLERQLYPHGLDRERWSLEAVPRVATFGGLVFAALDARTPDFDDWLGDDARWWLSTFILEEPLGGLEALPGWHRYRSPGNWKLMAENFIGDNYHVPVTHKSWARAAQELRERGVVTPMLTSPLPIRTKQQTYEVTAGYGSGCPLGLGALLLYSDGLYQRDLDDAKTLGPRAVEWIRDRQQRLNSYLKGRESQPFGFINGLLFPNLGLMGYISPLIGRHFLLFHPRGPEEHEIWQWTMVEREAPEEVKELAVARVYQGQHMAGVIAPDDVENFERVVEAMRARRSQRLPLNFEAHLDDDMDLIPDLPGNVGAEPSEVNQRQFYRSWLELMTHDVPATDGEVS